MSRLSVPTPTEQSHAATRSPPSLQFRVVTIVPSERQHALDHALEETFPASDPVSITITEVVRVQPTRRDVN